MGNFLVISFSAKKFSGLQRFKLIFLGVDQGQPFQSRKNETASSDLGRFDKPG
jgi:hypothetical protein